MKRSLYDRNMVTNNYHYNFKLFNCAILVWRLALPEINNEDNYELRRLDIQQSRR